jgi:hypothetical protein
MSRRPGKEMEKRGIWNVSHNLHSNPEAELESTVGSAVVAAMAGARRPFARMATTEKMMNAQLVPEETRTANDHLSSGGDLDDQGKGDFPRQKRESFSPRWIEAADKSLREYRFSGMESNSQLQVFFSAPMSVSFFCVFQFLVHDL